MYKEIKQQYDYSQKKYCPTQQVSVYKKLSK